MSIWMILLVVFLTGMLLGGDYCIKFATDSMRPWLWMSFTAVLWVLSIPGWYVTVKDERIAIIGMLFSVLSLVGTALIGVYGFNERLTVLEWVGFGFAIVAAVLLSGKV